MRRPPPASLLALALCCTPGCQRDEASAPDARALADADPTPAQQAAAPLAVTPAAGLAGVQDDVPRLRVARGRLTLGETVIPIDGFEAPTRGGSELLIEPLYDC